MTAPLPAWFVVLTSVVFWLLTSLLVGLLANRLPKQWLLQAREQPGHGPPVVPRHHAPPGIRVWKRWIPDGGPMLPGGIAKASLVRRQQDALQRLVIETRRAEWVHWTLWAAALLTALWLPWAGVLVNGLFACLFNLPCLLLQHHNRRRLLRCLARIQGSQ
jgi:glycosyl-4,4'-diaponeurosporenoate acyltransferase